MKQVKKLDFAGDEIYCGIDVHKKSWKVCIRNKYFEFKTFLQPPSVNILVNYLRKNFPEGNYFAVYEAGFCGFSYQREFVQHGVNCMVVHAADIPTTDKEKRSKSDTVDCRKLSQRLSEGSLKPIHIPCLRQQNDRHLLRTYKQFIKDQTVLKNRIKCWLFFQGIATPEELQSAEGHWTQKFIFYLKALPVTDPTAKASLELLLKGLDNVRQQVLEATRQLRALANQEHMKAQVELLRSVPGIGQLTALLLLTEIGDVNRFATFDRLASFVGLVPTMHTSDDKGYVGELTVRGHPVLRSAIVEASWRSVKDDPALAKAFSNYCKRMKKNKAIIKISRKLLSRIRFVLKHQIKYEKYLV